MVVLLSCQDLVSSLQPDFNLGVASCIHTECVCGCQIRFQLILSLEGLVDS